MTYKKHGRGLFAAAIACALTVGMLQGAGASVIRDAQDKIDEANEQLDQTNSAISDIENRQESLQREIDSLDSELVALLLDIEILSDEIDAKQEEIKQTSADLADAEEREQYQYESMKKRIRFMYERGDGALAETLLGAGSMADVLNRVEYFNQIYEYDRDMLEEYRDTVRQVADLKEQQEQEEQDMVALKENQEHQSAQLEQTIAEKRSTMDDFDVKLAQAESLAEQYKETIREQNDIIAAEQERQRRLEEERQRKLEEERERQRLAAAAEAERQAAAEAERQRLAEQAAASGGDAGTAAGSGTDSGTDASGGVPDGGSNPSYRTNVSGQEVVSYAQQFIGNPYVWGGTSLTDGCDCSGFVMSVYAHFGISLPHSSDALRSCGQAVSYNNAQPGDLICYSGHVAIYTGGGRIVGAQSTAVGIATQNATYRTILAVRRVL